MQQSSIMKDRETSTQSKQYCSNTYSVEITETLQLTAECDADTPAEAEEIIRNRYRNEDYILMADNLTSVEFKIVGLPGDFRMTPHDEKIRAVENKYGLFLFRMGLTHLMDVGIRHLSPENILSAVEQIQRESQEAAEQGKFLFMTPEFQIKIIRCAEELSAFSVWELFSYIKKYVHVQE